MKKIKYVLLGLFFITRICFINAQDFFVLKDSVSIAKIELEEISIKATKEASLLKNLPASVTVINDKIIGNNNVQSLKDLNAIIPNFFMPDYGSKLTSPVYIRGIGSRINSPSVGLYVDNVPYFEKSAFDFQFIDIDRIEVLRGPQGTLYGRNTMGGIINIFTKSPLDNPQSSLILSGGNFGYMQGSLNHYAKFGESTGISASFNITHNDGYFINNYTNENSDNSNVYGGRIKFIHEFSENFSIENIASLEYSDQNGYPYAVYNDSLKYNNDVNYDAVSGYERKMFSDAFVITYKLPHIHINSTTAYQMVDDLQEIDQDFTPASLFFVSQDQTEHTISQELTLKSNYKGIYEWVGGIYGFFQNTDKFVSVERIPTQITDLKGYDNNIYGQALFHQSSLQLTPDLNLTAGIRLDHENNRLNYVYDKLQNDTLSRIEDPLYTSLKFFKLTPKIAMSYKTGSSAIYWTISKGYKTGGYNATFDPGADPAYQAENSINYEVGLKSSLLNRSVYTDLALFYIDWRNQQIVQRRPSGVGTHTTNAGHSASKGVELSLRTIPVYGTEFNAAYGYTHATFLSYVKDEETNFNGNFIAFIPRHTLSLNALHTIPLRSAILDEIKINLLYRGIGKHFWNDENTAFHDYYGLLDLKVSFAREKLGLDFWVNNILNTDYLAYYFVSGSQFYQKGKPMRFGANLSLKF